MASKRNKPLYYFFMKVGNANCFLKYHQKLGGLWVGYDGDQIPKVNKDGIVVKGTEQADLRYMSVISQDKLKDSIRIVSYDKNCLKIFKVTGALRYLGKDTKIDWSLQENFNSFPSEWKKSVAKNLGGLGSQKFLNHVLGKSGWKLLPVELVQSIPRASLLAPIDSLSVWQSFNRRTFQPMFSLKGNHIYEKLDWLNNIENLESIQISEKEYLQEGLFGKLVRIYLDSKLDSSPSALSKLSSDELNQTIIALLNPAQVETIALHLSNDLGFTADVGLGKGLDVSDVKATVRHLAQHERTVKISNAISKLESLGVNFSEKLRSSIEATSTIRFQCKARGTSKDENLGTVLVIEAGSKDSQKNDTIYLENLTQCDSSSFPMFHEWLRVIRFDLSTFD